MLTTNGVAPRSCGSSAERTSSWGVSGTSTSVSVIQPLSKKCDPIEEADGKRSRVLAIAEGVGSNMRIVCARYGLRGEASYPGLWSVPAEHVSDPIDPICWTLWKRICR